MGDDITETLAEQISELIAWKRRQEESQADRLTEMNNAIIDIFTARHATITEIQTVLELVKYSMTGNFIKGRKDKALISQEVPTEIGPKKVKEYPAKIPKED